MNLRDASEQAVRRMKAVGSCNCKSGFQGKAVRDRRNSHSCRSNQLRHLVVREHDGRTENEDTRLVLKAERVVLQEVLKLSAEKGEAGLPFVKTVRKIHALRNQQHRLVRDDGSCSLRDIEELLSFSVSCRNLFDSFTEMTAVETLPRVFADRLGEGHQLLGEVAELLNTTVSFLQSRPDEVQLLLCKFYVDLWLCDKATLQRELDRIITVNGRTLSDISEYERKKVQEKTPAEPVQTADKVPTFEELYDAYQRRHVNDHFTREAHKHLAEIARRRQRDEQERVTQTEERERKNRP